MFRGGAAHLFLRPLQEIFDVFLKSVLSYPALKAERIRSVAKTGVTAVLHCRKKEPLQPAFHGYNKATFYRIK